MTESITRFSLFFSNAAIVDATSVRQCQCADLHDALAVWDALCRRFLVVKLYDADGKQVRAYSNLP